MIWVMMLLVSSSTIIVNNKWININQPINHYNTPVWTRDIYTKPTDVNIFISSSGGSVVAGMDIIAAIEAKNINHSTTCVAHHAYSMAFAIFQSCKKRYVMQNSILMQHQMAIKIDDQFSRVNTYMNFIDSLKLTLDQKQASRLGMTVPLFNRAINNDWWLFGDLIIKFNAADGIVAVICEPSIMSKTYDFSFMTHNAYVQYTYCLCPLVVQPIDVKTKPHSKNIYIDVDVDNNDGNDADNDVVNDDVYFKKITHQLE